MRVELRQVTGIVDSASLQAAVIEYLARDQDTVLIARIPSFIQMFEAKVNRSLFARQMESRAQAQTDPAVNSEPEYIALPADFQTMRRMRVTSGNRQPPLQFLSGTQMDEMRPRTPTSPASRNISRSSETKSNSSRRRPRSRPLK
jgi:hypothetical protein